MRRSDRHLLGVRYAQQDGALLSTFLAQRVCPIISISTLITFITVALLYIERVSSTFAPAELYQKNQKLKKFDLKKLFEEIFE